MIQPHHFVPPPHAETHDEKRVRLLIATATALAEIEAAQRLLDLAAAKLLIINAELTLQPAAMQMARTARQAASAMQYDLDRALGALQHLHPERG